MNFKKKSSGFVTVISILIILLFFLIVLNFTGCCISKDSVSDFMKDIIESAKSITGRSFSEVETEDVETDDSVIETQISEPVKFKIYIEEEIPDYYEFLIIRELVDILTKSEDYGYEFISNEEQADFIFTIESCYEKQEEESPDSLIFFVPVVSFYNMIEDITWQALGGFWDGSITSFEDIEGNEIEAKIVISQEVFDILEKMLGECRAENLEVVKNYEILPIIDGRKIQDLGKEQKTVQKEGEDAEQYEEEKDTGQKKDDNGQKQEEQTELEKEKADASITSISLIPFDSLQPGFKVLSLDGVSVLDKNLEVSSYPLVFEIKLDIKDGRIPEDIFEEVKNSFNDKQFSNRNTDDIVTVMMTGVTALTRQIAARMDKHGVLYPAEKIAEVLWDADITHISNEVSFVENCYAAKPYTTVFCSKPEYMELIKYIDADVIELTGNHLNDYGSKWLSYTIDIYDREGISYFGGGRNLVDACRPALFEINGYKFAFLGANTVGPSYDWADEDSAGSAPINTTSEVLKEIDMQKFENIVKDLAGRGYNVIFTFQYHETENYFPTEQQVLDFERMIDAGAVIVSGSQSHVPQGVKILNNGFINYGLGNLFFGQQPRDALLALKVRQGIIAKHVFYKGSHISTVLISTMIEDASQPRVMTEIERAELLKAVFKGSIR